MQSRFAKQGVVQLPRLNTSMWVEAPPDVVFRMIESPTRPLLPPGGPRFRLVSADPGLGAYYRWELRRLGLVFRADSAVVEYLPGEKIVFEGRSGWEMRAEVLLSPEGRGARLHFRMEYRFSAPLRWLISGRLIRLGVWYALCEVRSMAESCIPRT